MANDRPDDLAAAVKACRRHFVTAAVFSLALNLLYLAAPLYMMQVYDRVIASGSEMTLLMLTAITLCAFVALAGIDRARTSVLSAASLRLDRLLSARVFAAMMGDAVRDGDRYRQALRDLDTCRQFVSGHGMNAIFDLPWLPLYILFIGAGLHPALGAFALSCALLLAVLAVVSEWRVRAISHDAQTSTVAAYAWAETSLRNAQAVQAMGMMPGLARRWGRDRRRAVFLQREAAERAAGMTALVRFLRLSMQSLVLGLGAWLVIERAVSPGAIFAASLLLGRALQPVEQIIGQWQTMLAARAAFARLRALLAAHPALPAVHPAVARGQSGARLEGRIAAEDLGYEVAGRPGPILSGLNFTIEPGDSVGLIGPSGAGKSTLVRLLAGALPPTAGCVRLGGVDARLLAGGQITGGREFSSIGYLPQDIELFDDTIAANISRFRACPDAEIARAAQIAGAHEMILRLPQGYRTVLGEAGGTLSGGMRQRIALARAVFDQPSIVILDEPSSNLDAVGDAALAHCIGHLQARGTTVILVSHRPASANLMHKFLVLIDGRLQAFGTRMEVMQRLALARQGAREAGTINRQVRR
jgi:ATP-binding cassette, subfamily C, bacterial